MIRVNLIRNRIQDSSTTQATSAAPVMASPAETAANRELVLKIVCILIFTIGLYLYENQNLRALNEEQARLQAQVNQMKTQAAERQQQADKIKDVESLAKELSDKLKILKLLSKLRLREVKTLDFMQSSIPEKVWLKAVNYESDKERVEAGHFQFSGLAVATEDLTEFVKRLDESAYLMDVIVVKNQETAVNKNTVRDFLFTAEVENKSQ